MKEKLASRIHLVLVILIWISPFILNWKWILFGVAIQKALAIKFKGCILTNIQFKEQAEEMTYYTYLLEKMGFSPNRKTMRFLSKYVIPIMILAITFIWQIILERPTII